MFGGNSTHPLDSTLIMILQASNDLKGDRESKDEVLSSCKTKNAVD